MAGPQFTPGPWRWHTSNSWRRLKRDDHGISMNVLEPFVHGRDQHPDCTVSEADMALIAAAPELYNALAELLRHCERLFRGWPVLPSEVVARNRTVAALAKARGEMLAEPFAHDEAAHAGEDSTDGLR